MNYILEAFSVGLYCGLLFILLYPFLHNSLVLFFLLGFLKHFLAYFLSIHDYYCKKCLKNENVKAKFEPVLYQSVLEGVYFMILGSIGFSFLHTYKALIIFFFFVGFITHIICEWLGIHNFFCRVNCSVKK